jgi:putative transposase
MVESFNGKFREECLNAHWFESIEDAKQKIDAWRWDYNEHRPHRSLEGLTPREFAAKAICQGSQTHALRGPNFPGRSSFHDD